MLRDAELLVPPRVVFRETGRVREQVSQRDARRIVGRVTQSTELRDIPLRRIIERQLALVAQLEDRHRGERLGHAGDAEHRIALHRSGALHIPQAGGAEVRQAAIDHDAPGSPRDVLSGDELAHDAIDLRVGGRELGGAGGIIECRPIGRRRGSSSRCVDHRTEQSENERRGLWLHDATVPQASASPKHSMG